MSIALNSLWEAFQKKRPDLCELLNPRSYGDLGRFNSPRLAAAAAVMPVSEAIYGSRNNSPEVVGGRLMNISHWRDPNMSHAYFTVANLLRWNMPTFFVTEELIDALNATSLPETVKINEIKWPLGAMQFIFPQGKIQSPFDGECPFLAVSYNKAGPRTTPGNMPDCVTESDSISYYTTGIRNDCPIFAGNLLVDDQTTKMWLENAATLIQELFIPNKELLKKVCPDHPDNLGVLHEKDKEFSDHLLRLAIKLVMAMVAKPELVSMGTCIRPAKIKNGRRKTEIWTPNILGRSYHVKSESSGDGSGHHRLHWKRGHFRQQPYGPRENPTYETIWIEPFLSGKA